jgi:hypothetical protein
MLGVENTTVATCTRVSEAAASEFEEGENALSVFPNPSHNKFNVVFTSVADGNCSITLVDILGKVVMTEQKCC